MTNYSFLQKSTKPQIIGMDEVLAFENAENPKEAIRRMVDEAKQRRTALSIDEQDVGIASALTSNKDAVQIKTQKTLKLGKQKSGITVKMVKSGDG